MENTTTATAIGFDFRFYLFSFFLVSLRNKYWNYQISKSYLKVIK